MTAGSDDLWDVWARARIDGEVDGRTRILRGPCAEALPASAPVFVLTAYNPGGIEREEALNRVSQAALEAELASTGAALWPANGFSRDAGWSEPGVAVGGLTRADACALGGRYGQLAVYELTDDEVRVVRCDDGEPVRARPRRE